MSKYDEQIIVRVGSSQKRTLKKLSEKHKISLSDLCRNILSEGKVYIPREKEYLPCRIDSEVATNLKKIGGLLKLAIAKDASNRQVLNPLIIQLKTLANKIEKL